MARTVIVFRDNMIERERLAASPGRSNRAREARSETIAATIARFETSVDEMLGQGRAARRSGWKRRPASSTTPPTPCRPKPAPPRAASLPRPAT